MDMYSEQSALGENDKYLEEVITNVAYKKIEALSELYNLTKFAVYGFAISLLKSHAEAKTVLYNTYLSIWKSAYMYSFEGKPMPWIIMVAQFHCFKALRNRQWTGKGENLKEHDIKTESFILSTEEKQVLNAFLNTLDDADREIIILSTFCGFKLADLADFFKTVPTKAFLRNLKAFKKLKANLKANPEASKELLKANTLKNAVLGAICKTCPEVWGDIAFDVPNKKGDIVPRADRKPKKRAFSLISNIAAVLVVVSLTLFGITNYNRADEKIVSAVCIEEKLQIEIFLNRYNVVLKATGETAEGEKLLSGLDLEGGLLDESVEKVLSAMVKNGYLKSEGETVSVTVKNDTSQKVQSLKENVADYIENSKSLKGYNFVADVKKSDYTVINSESSDK